MLFLNHQQEIPPYYWNLYYEGKLLVYR